MNGIPNTTELLKFFHDNGYATIIVMSRIIRVIFNCNKKEIVFCLTDNIRETVEFNELEKFEAMCSFVEEKLIWCNNKF